MADIQGTLASERWLDEFIVLWSKSNVGADTSDKLLMPAGVGDAALMELMVIVVDTATILADAVLAQTGLFVFVQTAVSSVDFAGVAKFYRASATRLAAYLSPDPLVQVKSGEVLNIQYPELDTNASPTDDHSIYGKFVRVSSTERAVRGPIRLVR